MTAVFELRDITQRWNPPFDKTVEVATFNVSDNESFHPSNRLKKPVFRLVRSEATRALVEYHREFTLKGYEQPANRQTWIEKDQFREFSHLWGEHGTTKKLTYKGLNGTG